jgi:hypothetical protein
MNLHRDVHGKSVLPVHMRWKYRRCRNCVFADPAFASRGKRQYEFWHQKDRWRSQLAPVARGLGPDDRADGNSAAAQKAIPVIFLTPQPSVVWQS